ncbi:hypothetical protein [Sporosarcina sp. SAFN-015]
MTTPKKKLTTKVGEFIGYSIVALYMLALVVGGFFAHLALIRWGLRIWPL